MAFLRRLRRLSSRRDRARPGERPATVPEQRAAAAERVAELIRPGFLARAEAEAAAVDLVTDDDESYPDLTATDARTLAATAWDRLRAEQAASPGEGDYPRLRAAFDELEATGIVARMHFACCSTCGHHEIDDERSAASRGYTFFHAQDSERLGPDDSVLFLAFGSFVADRRLDPDLLAAAAAGDAGARSRVADASDEGIAADVVGALHRQGLAVEWNGTAGQRIQVAPLDWRKRLPPPDSAGHRAAPP